MAAMYTTVSTSTHNVTCTHCGRVFETYRSGLASGGTASAARAARESMLSSAGDPPSNPCPKCGLLHDDTAKQLSLTFKYTWFVLWAICGTVGLGWVYIVRKPMHLSIAFLAGSVLVSVLTILWKLDFNSFRMAEKRNRDIVAMAGGSAVPWWLLGLSCCALLASFLTAGGVVPFMGRSKTVIPALPWLFFILHTFLLASIRWYQAGHFCQRTSSATR
ncbi:MAG: hypothetical protein HN919_05765 [Verrucomicrobia bacterium]|jgi:hypothetical protein|nr:hypothetical protein [Verrucomicrobiota bacterium]MBT7065787.1 hypothetical protein [Verrucomicrobiota bacterium]MBT7699226.1 hypothetical protein [Verrucomicrobiota bacterium]